MLANKLKRIAVVAMQHGFTARVTAGHVLVIDPYGALLATRSYRRLYLWMGY